MSLGLLLALALSAFAAEPPFQMMGVEGQRDIGGFNQNDRALSDAVRRTDLTNGGSVSGSLAVDGTLTVDQITFPDGTSQTTAASAAASVSSRTCVDLTGFADDGYVNTQYLGRAISGSTVSLTASSFTVIFEGSFCDNTNCANSSGEAITFIVDGGYPPADSGLGLPALSSSRACKLGGAPAGNGGSAYIMCKRQVRLAHGHHIFAAVSNNYTNNNSGIVRCHPAATCRFCVWEGLHP